MTGYVVVGVVPQQPDTVLEHASRFARHFDAELVCAYVDTGRYPVEENSDGSVRSMPIDPDDINDPEEVAYRSLQEHIGRLLDTHAARWSFRPLAGEPGQALATLADHLDAAMIVVGTRHAGARRSMHEFFGGSVAVHLAHRQHRAVVIVPLNPVADADELPWHP